MAINLINTDLQYFPQFSASKAIAGAQIYVGLPDTDPTILANQIQVYAVQEDGTTVSITQPVQTGAGGVPTYNGSPVQIACVDDTVSMKVLSSIGSQIYYKPSISQFVSAANATVNVQDYAAIRTYTGAASSLQVTGLLATAQPQGIAGTFALDTTDTTSGAVFTGSISGNTLTVTTVSSGALAIGQAVNRGDTGATVGYITAGSGTSWTISGAGATIGSMTMTADNGGTVIVAANGKRWKRQYSGFVNVKWFGAAGDGVTDDRAVIQAALNASTRVYFPAPTVSYYISDSVSPQINSTIFGDGNNSHIQIKDGSVNGFYLNGVSGVIVRDLKISTTSQTNATAYKAGILMANECRNCLVENVSMFNMGYWGVGILSSSNCIVRGCRFTTWFGTVQDSAGICVFKTSNNNLIESNYCYANSNHGIFIQDPYTNDTPTGNLVINNSVSNAITDGICIYVTTAYDTQTLISGNRIFDITGTGLSGQSGHGIYVQSSGGTLVTNNTLTNCCSATTSFETQVVAAIGVSTGDLSIYPTGTINEVVVSGNHITAQRGPGISVQTCGVPVLVEGNTILSTGTTAVRGEAIYSVNADGIQIKNNTIKHANTNYNAIGITASAKTLNGISVVGNRIRGTTYGISLTPAGGGSFTNVVLTENIITELSNIGMYLQAITGAQVSNNNVSSTGPVLYHSGCQKVRYSANRFYSSSGGYSIIFTGAANSNAGTIVDESNDLSGVIENDAGTGCIISQYGNSAPPGSGLWAVSDRVIQSVSVIGQPKGWRCTTAGNPGTWTSEGNL